MTAPGTVLVHDLWHDAWCWDDVRAALAERGIDSVAVELPLTGLAVDGRHPLGRTAVPVADHDCRGALGGGPPGQRGADPAAP